MEVIDFATLTTWQNTREEEQGPKKKAKSKDAPFPYNKEVNKKVVLWNGDAIALNTEVITNETNETMDSPYGISGRILKAVAIHVCFDDAAGPQLKAELSTMDACKTGEVRVSQAYDLPSKLIVHSVGPRYNENFLTAAENALNTCYRLSMQAAVEHEMRTIAISPFHAESKGYTAERAVHVVLRTLRRFLDKHGALLDCVVLAFQDKVSYGIFEDIMPLYFPRSGKEQDAVQERLPSDIGNELGETVRQERSIRVGMGIGRRSDSVSAASKDNSSSSVASGSGVAAPSSTNTNPQRPPQPIEDAFNQLGGMSSDPDKQKREERERRRSLSSGVDTKADPTVEENYRELLSHARQLALDDIRELDVVYHGGVDDQGRDVIVWMAHNLPAKQIDLQRVLLYLVKTMDKYVENDYVIVFFHSADSSHKPPLNWFRKTYKQLSRKYKKNLKALYIVHPTWWVKTMFFLFRPFLSNKFYKKLCYISNLDDLNQHVARRQLRIPDHVLRFDFKKNNPSQGEDTQWSGTSSAQL